MKSAFRVPLFVIALILAALSLPADAIRGSVVEILEINADKPAEAGFHLEELTALGLGEGAEFFTGIEIELSIPTAITRMRNSFAVYLYRRVDPQPETGTTIRYFGQSLDYYVVPAGRKMYLQIPLRNEAVLQETPETLRIPYSTAESDYPILLTVLPIMKGIPSDIYNAEFTLKAYPYLADEGILDVEINAPDNRPFTLLIDGEQKSYREGGYLLSSGVHQLSIESDSYLPLQRTITVNKGSNTPVTLRLEKREPRLNFETPEGTVIFLDGERINSTSLKVDEGNHTVVFKLGDYSMTREFEVTGGKSYTVTLFFDIFVKEN